MKATKIVPDTYDIRLDLSLEEAKVVEFFLNHASSEIYKLASEIHDVDLSYEKYDPVISKLWRVLFYAIGEENTLRVLK